MKCAPKSGPPISYTIEDEVKPDGVAGKLTLKYVEPSTGISFDKVTLKGSAYGVEASKTVSGVKCKAKLDPFDVGTLSGSAELKESNFTATCGADSKKIVGSATASPFAGGVLGFSFEYPTGGGALALSAGGSATVQGVFASCIYTSKKVFNFGLMFDATPDITVAATGDSHGPGQRLRRPQVDVRLGLAGITSLGVKTTTAALSLSPSKSSARTRRSPSRPRRSTTRRARRRTAPSSRSGERCFPPLPTAPPPRGLTMEISSHKKQKRRCRRRASRAPRRTGLLLKRSRPPRKAGTIVENGAQPALPTRCATIDASVAKSANKLVEALGVCCDGWSALTRSHHVTAPQSERDAIGDENSAQRADGDEPRGAPGPVSEFPAAPEAVEAEQRQHGRDRAVGEDDDRERRARRVVVRQSGRARRRRAQREPRDRQTVGTRERRHRAVVNDAAPLVRGDVVVRRELRDGRRGGGGAERDRPALGVDVRRVVGADDVRERDAPADGQQCHR